METETQRDKGTELLKRGGEVVAEGGIEKPEEARLGWGTKRGGRRAGDGATTQGEGEALTLRPASLLCRFMRMRALS